MTTAARSNRVLMIGFAPFDGETINPSWQAASRLDSETVAGHAIVARELPTEFAASLPRLLAAIYKVDPALVLCVGQAGGRAQISLERIAINLNDARIADNAGWQPIDESVIPDGPAAYFATLSLKSMLTDLRTAGIPVEVSQRAGTYVCNHVFYGLMHALRDRPEIRAGFIHIPYAPEQAIRRPGASSLALDTVVEGLRIAIRTAPTKHNDARIAAGA